MTDVQKWLLTSVTGYQVNNKYERKVSETTNDSTPYQASLYYQPSLPYTIQPSRRLHTNDIKHLIIEATL